MRKLLAALTGAVVLVVGACTFVPDLSRFAACDPAGGCPSGTSCLAAENRCLPACGEGGPCDDGPAPVDDAGTEQDAGVEVDAGSVDSGVADAGEPDPGTPALALEPSLPDAIEGASYSARIQARGGTPPYAFTATSDLPEGISIDSAGHVIGKPPRAGNLSLPMEVTDSGNPRKRARGNLTLYARPLLRIAGPEPLADAASNRDYTERISATGGKGPYSFALAPEQSLPSGLTLAADGTITGTTTQAGKTSFMVVVTDSDTPPQSVTGTLSITLTNATGNVKLLSRAVPTGRVGSDYSYTLQTTGGSGSLFSWSVKDGALPPGILFDTKEGVLYGKPTSGTDFTFEISVVDLLANDKQSYSLHVD
ncbi:putative Ig domain-containing protein [Corallococcus macrosporus]|uniref:Ig domain-containing protein n=1 Tax=Corallococcus macrosporus TaxID=35 RepID=A0ABS3D5R3_9BACT|nr:Ig domain-containing protein [Corallococcus macrosporus]MBN8226242.1 putative Ig domain-containing protein [Corallococcus macrosporus]